MDSGAAARGVVVMAAGQDIALGEFAGLKVSIWRRHQAKGLAEVRHHRAASVWGLKVGLV